MRAGLTRAVLGHHHKLVTGNLRLLLRCATIKVSSCYHLGEASLFSLVAASDDLYPIRLVLKKTLDYLDILPASKPSHGHSILTIEIPLRVLR
ncbi:hypothetical protein ACSS6W_001875 [Trichoderma asperelloides]